MEKRTPLKQVQTNAPGRPRAVFRKCCVCQRDLLTFKKYTRVDKITATQLIAATRIRGDFSTLMICVTCKNRVHKVSEGLPTNLTKEQLREALQQHIDSASTRTKRMSTDSPSTLHARMHKRPSVSNSPPPTSSRKKLFYSPVSPML